MPVEMDGKIGSQARVTKLIPDPRFMLPIALHRGHERRS